MHVTTTPPTTSDMAHVMAVLIKVSDAWSLMADNGQASAVLARDPRLELLGVLVQLVSRRSHGLRDVPTRDDLEAEVREGRVQLRLRSRGRVPFETDVVERQLARFGFVVERVPGTEGRELVMAWSRDGVGRIKWRQASGQDAEQGPASEGGATVIELPSAKLAIQRRRRQRLGR